MSRPRLTALRRPTSHYTEELKKIKDARRKKKHCGRKKILENKFPREKGKEKERERVEKDVVCLFPPVRSFIRSNRDVCLFAFRGRKCGFEQTGRERLQRKGQGHDLEEGRGTFEEDWRCYRR